MADFKEWTTNFTGDNPLQDSDPVTTEQPELENDPTATAREAGEGDNTRVSQIHTLRDKLHTVAKYVGDSTDAPVTSLRARVTNLEGAAGVTLSAKGDLLSHDGASSVRVPITEVDGLIPISDSTEEYGWRWGKLPEHGDVHEGITDAWIRESKQVGDNSNDQLGEWVSLSGNTCIARSDILDNYVSIFVRTSAVWSLQQKISGGFSFAAGDSVDISSDTCIVGAAGETSNTGAAYIYTRSSGVWSLEQKITAGDAATGDYFGFSVAIDGNTAVIAAPGDSSSAGSVYIYTRSGTTWSLEQKITASDTGAGDYFGWAVDIDEDSVVIGAVFNDPTYSNAGSAYIFTRSITTWTEQQIITDPVGINDYFGRSVSINGDTVAIGIQFANDNGVDSGAVSIWTRSAGTWTKHTRLTPSDAAADDRFGCDVGLSNTTLIIGAMQTTNTIEGNGRRSGSAYVYTLVRGVWTLQQEIIPIEDDLYPPDQTRLLYFGKSVAVDGDLCIVGEESGATDATNVWRGAVYAYSRYVDLIPVLGFAEYEFETAGTETPGDTVSFALTSYPNGEGAADTPSGYRILVFKNGVKLRYTSPLSTSDQFYYDDVDNEVDVLATGSADNYEVVYM